MKTNKFPLNLQFFAEPSGDGAVEDGGKEPNATGEGGKEDTKETGEDPSDTAKRDKEGPAERADTDHKKEDIAALVQEEIKKAAMSPEERVAYEKSEKEKNLEERESAISLRERRADAKELLADNNLPAEFQDMVMGKTKEETQENVRKFREKFDAAVQAQVEVRLKGRTPAAGTGYTGGNERETLLAQVESYL